MLQYITANFNKMMLQIKNIKLKKIEASIKNLSTDMQSIIRSSPDSFWMPRKYDFNSKNSKNNLPGY